jgi:Carboxypeptidase regulatory-like domain
MQSSNRRLLACLLWIACAFLSAQEFRALISGIVQDPTGSAIPGATVRIKNVGTNLVVTVQSGPDGAYFIPQLPVGTYQLSAEANGFKQYTRTVRRLRSSPSPPKLERRSIRSWVSMYRPTDRDSSSRL